VPIFKQEQLVEICHLINKNKIVAIDTEFVRETTYKPVLCLIQINVEGECYLIDALSGLDLQPFFAILNDPEIIKIIHSSRQDIEVLLQNFPEQTKPQSIFDTQIMAALSGVGFAISYSNLAKNLLDEDIDKNHQRSDWQKRPLTKEQIEYARIDVLHLPKIYQILKTKLAEQNKLDWAVQEMDLNIAKALAKDDLCKNFSFINKSAIYRENVTKLVKWRDDLARKYNVPRSFVIKDDLLDKIAFSNPKTIDQLAKCGFKTKISQPIEEEIINLLQDKNYPIDFQLEKEELQISSKLSEEQKIIYQKSRALLISQAEKFQISPELIINQSSLQAIISGNKSVDKILSGWRYPVFGEELEKLIAN
jgi:ribonuclease D